MKRGQAGIEYVLLTGLLLLFFIPLIHYALSETNTHIKLSQAESYVNRVARSVDTVHSIGPGAIEIVTITVPKGVVAYEFNTDGEINEINVEISFAGGISDMHASVKPQIAPGSALPIAQGTYHIQIESINETAVMII